MECSRLGKSFFFWAPCSYINIEGERQTKENFEGDFCLNESRAIAAYIANKYKKDGTIYPQVGNSVFGWCIKLLFGSPKN